MLMSVRFYQAVRVPAALCWAAGLGMAAPAPAPAPGTPAVLSGLHVDSSGVLLRDGKPYRGIGVNYVSAFTRVLANPDDRSYREGFKELGRRGIPFARIWIMGYWPAENKLYQDDRREFYKRLDDVVRCAADNHVGLIPSFFFNFSTVPDLVGEPVSEWGNPASKTTGFMRQFVREVVNQYGKSPVIWGWEFGNEMNLAADLPNAAEHRPAAVPQLGTPDQRTAKDDTTHAMMRAAVRLFAQEVRKWDTRLPILTGNTFPRASAWHQMTEKSWTADNEEQYAEMLTADSPDPLDTLSGHLYAGETDRFGRKLAMREYLTIATGVAARAKKPLVIGEFGAPGLSAKEPFMEILAAIDKSGVPLAALWVYDFASQDKDWNVTASNSRAYMLDEIAKLNQGFGAKPAPR